MGRVKRRHRERAALQGRLARAAAGEGVSGAHQGPRAFRWYHALLFPSGLFGVVLMLAGAACPVQLARWETEDRAIVATHGPEAAGIANPDALRPATVLTLCVLPLLVGATLVVRGYRQAHNEHRYGDPNPDLRVRDAAVLFDAGRQLPKVRFVMWLSVATALGSAWAARAIAVPAAGEATVGSVAGGVLVGLLGVGFAGGMWLYGRQYIAEVRRVAPGRLVVRVVRLFGHTPLEYRDTDLTPGRRHEGRATSYVFSEHGTYTGITVHAPWQAVYVPDRRWPLILDGQGWFRQGADDRL